MPPQNPLTRIRRVAEDLRELAEELEAPVGPDAKRALVHWRDELLSAVGDLESLRAADRQPQANDGS